MEKREFRQVSRTGKTRIWTIEVVGAEIRSAYGEDGGKMQTVVDVGVGKNIGRSNEVTPEEDALYEAGRAILKKTRTGYTEEGSERATSIDWNSTLPINLRFYKPDNTLSTALLKKVEARTAWLGRKRDGECLVIVKGPDGHVDVYSRTMLRCHHLEVGQYEWRDRLVRMVAELEARTDVPNNSILLGDIVGDAKDDTRWSIASFMKSLTPEALDDMPPPFLYVWDIPFWDGADLASTLPIGKRYELIWDVFDHSWKGTSWFLPVEVWEVGQLRRMFHDKPEQDIKDHSEFAQAVSKKWKWEGWVVVDPEGTYGDKAYNFRGKTDRPGKFCGKLKPCYEDDFVAKFDPNNARGEGVQGKWGSGNNRGMVGAVSLYQYNSTGDLIYICECGGGIDDKFREKYSDPADYPIVLQVEYTARTYKSEGEKTDALTYPRVLGVRFDKKLDECINPRL
jgi:hypothetical protein